MVQEIKLKNVDSPKRPNLKKDTIFICRSLGFIGEQDKEVTSEKIFNAILESAINRYGSTTEQLSDQIKVSRGTVIHHLNNYIDSGMIIREKTRYTLRVPSLEKTIEEVEFDAIRMFANLKRIARDIDKSLGLQLR